MTESLNSQSLESQIESSNGGFDLNAQDIQAAPEDLQQKWMNDMLKDMGYWEQNRQQIAGLTNAPAFPPSVEKALDGIIGSKI